MAPCSWLHLLSCVDHPSRLGYSWWKSLLVSLFKLCQLITTHLVCCVRIRSGHTRNPQVKNQLNEKIRAIFNAAPYTICLKGVDACQVSTVVHTHTLLSPDPYSSGWQYGSLDLLLLWTLVRKKSRLVGIARLQKLLVEPMRCLERTKGMYRS